MYGRRRSNHDIVNVAFFAQDRIELNLGVGTTQFNQGVVNERVVTFGQNALANSKQFIFHDHSDQKNETFSDPFNVEERGCSSGYACALGSLLRCSGLLSDPINFESGSTIRINIEALDGEMSVSYLLHICPQF
jgi:hypothetical protein